MNYYIQGNAAKADQIKAAFEKLGIDVIDFGFADKTVVYCSIGGCGGCVQSLPYSINLMHILHSHPDYKELELPAQPKFKVGDWIVRGEGFVYEPSLITEIRDYYICELLNGERATYTLNDVHKNFHLWTIADAKDGDVLVTTKVRNCPFIYRKNVYNNNLAYYYVGIDGNGDFCEGCIKRTLSHFGPVADVVPATKEQRDLLFANMREAGYEWDAGKKELKKIKPHYDISNFKPFDKVLVRDRNDGCWRCAWFSGYDETLPFPFITTGADYRQCIPFERNKHLFWTTDPCDEEYINW